MKTSALLCGFLAVCSLVVGLLAGCQATNSSPDASSYPSDVYLVDMPVDVVNATLSKMCHKMNLVVSQEKMTGVDGQFKITSASSAAVITTVANGLSQTKIAVAPYPYMFVEEHRAAELVDTRSMTNLQKGLGFKIREIFEGHLLSK